MNAASGLFGKIPARPDFVRVRAADPAALALATWLEAGSEALARRSGMKGDEPPVRFVFSIPGARNVLLGALKGSVDKVGRRFPLAAFVLLDAKSCAAVHPVLPAAGSAFFERVVALLEQSHRLLPEDIPPRLDALPALDLAALTRESGALAARLGSTPLPSLVERLFGGTHTGQVFYALHCLKSACQGLRGREPTQAGVVLMSPATLDEDRFLWLELCRRATGWPRPTTFFFGDGDRAQLLIALGAPPAAALGALWNPSHRDGKLWPLATEKLEAVAAARKALGPGVEDCLSRPGATLADLVTTLYP
jgi:type VI secretion system protein ImpM